MVVKPGEERDAERLDRLITAVERMTNMLGRLIGALETKHVPRATTRMRRVPADKPITVTPLVEAAVKRALARVRR